MAKATKSQIAKTKQVVVEEPVGRYINPLSDFGFKRIFGVKELLLDFLNAGLNIEGGIVDLQYDNTERPGRSEDDRTAIFDLYCTLKNGEHIIIEMQNHNQKFFRDRTLYYASRLIQEQGEDKIGKSWNFELSPVYSVNIVNFELDKENTQKASDKYSSYVQLLDVETREVFYKKLTFVFFELPLFTKEEHQLENSVDRWIYVLKNLARLNHLPEALRNRIFEILFLNAEIAKLSKKDRKEYDRSLKKLKDMNIIVADRERIIAERDGKIAVLSKDNAVLSKDNAVKDKTITSLQREVEELRRKLGLSVTAKRQRRRQLA